MPGLMDFFGGGGNFADAIGNNRNSLIGLGMGMLAPSYPTRGESPWSNALQGFQGGANLDAQNQRYRQQLAQHQADRAQAQANADRAFKLQERQFDEANWTPGVYKDASTEQEYPYQQDRRNGNIRWLMGSPPGGGPGARALDQFAGAVNPLAPNTSSGFAPSPTGPAVGYGQAGMGQSGFGSGTATVEPSIISPGTAAPTVASPSSQYAAPAGMLPSQAKAYREEVAKQGAKAQIAVQHDAVNSAKAAAEFKPAVDEMVAAYEALTQAGGIGPVQGTGIARTAQAVTGFGADKEALRQRYDTASAKVKALITAAQNKGEGQVSNYERKMYGMQFPQLTALDPGTQLPFLKQLQEATNQTIEAGRGTSLGPGATTYERAPIRQGGNDWTDVGNGIRVRPK